MDSWRVRDLGGRRKQGLGEAGVRACAVRLIGLALEAQNAVVRDEAVQVTAESLAAAAWTSE